MQAVLKSILLFEALILMYSCGTSSERTFEEGVAKNDTSCLKEIQNAKVDISNNQLFYCHNAGNIIFRHLRSQQEMDSLLSMFGIGFRTTTSPCVIEENKMYDCYCEMMAEAITAKHGPRFADSLVNVSDSLWVIKNRDIVFTGGLEGEEWDTPPLFPGDTSFDQTNHFGLQEALKTQLKYPAGYVSHFSNDSLALLNVNLFVDEKGRASVKQSDFVFGNNSSQEYNVKHYAYLRSVIIPLIEETPWKPATVKSTRVRSTMNILVSLQ